mgnify:FL=1
MTMIASIAPERKETLTRMIADASRKATDDVLAHMESRGVITGDNFQRVLAQGDKVAAQVSTVVREGLSDILAELAENLVGRLRLISGGKSVKLDATDGKETLTKAKDVFVYVDPDFKNWGCDVKSEATPETEVAVYEMVKDGTFQQLFGGFGENLDRLCLSQAQIKAFARDQKNWLRSDGYATFFLFKVGSDFFVAYVDVYAVGLNVYVCRLSNDYVWHAESRHRIVVPQLVLKP